MLIFVCFFFQCIFPIWQKLNNNFYVSFDFEINNFIFDSRTISHSLHEFQFIDWSTYLVFCIICVCMCVCALHKRYFRIIKIGFINLWMNHKDDFWTPFVKQEYFVHRLSTEENINVGFVWNNENQSKS